MKRAKLPTPAPALQARVLLIARPGAEMRKLVAALRQQRRRQHPPGGLVVERVTFWIDAVVAFRSKDYDVVIIDLDKENVSLVKQLRGVGRRTPIVALAPLNLQGLGRDALRAGAFTVMLKPLDQTSIERLSHLLRLGKAARQVEKRKAAFERSTAEAQQIATTTQQVLGRDDSLRAAAVTRDRLAEIMDSITEGFVAVDREWRCTYANGEAAWLLRNTRERLLGKNLWKEFPDLVGTTFEAEFRRALTKQIPSEFEAFYAPLNTWFETRAYPSAEGLWIQIRDITPRKRDEEHLLAMQGEMAARLADVSTLYEMGARLSSLELMPLLQEVLAAVNGIIRGDKAVMMFYDRDLGTLRMVSSIGFNTEAQQELQRVPPGAGSWAKAFREQRPVLIEDMEKAPGTEFVSLADLAGYRSVFSIPLATHAGAPIGVIAVYFHEAHRVSNREIRLVEVYSRQAVECIDNARLYRETREATEGVQRHAAQLRSVTEAALAMSSTHSPKEALQALTDHTRRIIGAHRALGMVVLGGMDTPTLQAVSLSDRDAALGASVLQGISEELVEAVRQGNRPVRKRHADLPAPSPESGPEDEAGTAATELLAVPLIARDGRNMGLIQVSDKQGGEFTDQDEAIIVQVAQMAAAVIENARLYAEAESAERRFAFLAEAGAVLARSLDYEITLQTVAELVVPHLADWCLVDLVSEDGSLRRMAVAHADPMKTDTAQNLRQPIAHAQGPARALPLQTGFPELFPEVSESLLAHVARDADELALLRDLNIHSCIRVPLRRREQTLGVITFFTAESNRWFGQEDLVLVRELARRAALAIEHASLYHQAQEAIHRKDESLALLDTLLGSAPIGFAFVDPELRFVRINQSLADMNGVPREQHLGRPVHDILPELAEDVEPRLRRVLKTGEPLLDQEVHGETRATPGLRRSWLSSYYPVRTPAGQVLGVGVVVVEITERKRVEEQLKSSLKEKEVLLKEIHHRVKNNLQIISSLLRFQSEHADRNPQVVLQESQNRIRSMALLHEKLYRSPNLSKLDFTEYIRSLASHLMQSYPLTGAVKMRIDAGQLFLDVDSAIPCGLIFNELVSNALKHAFPDGAHGEIAIELQANDDIVTLRVSDDGVGFPEEIDFRNTESIGLQLVSALTDQLEGTIELRGKPGTEFKIAFPANSRA